MVGRLLDQRGGVVGGVGDRLLSHRLAGVAVGDFGPRAYGLDQCGHVFAVEQHLRQRTVEQAGRAHGVGQVVAGEGAVDLHGPLQLPLGLGLVAVHELGALPGFACGLPDGHAHGGRKARGVLPDLERVGPALVDHGAQRRGRRADFFVAEHLEVDVVGGGACGVVFCAGLEREEAHVGQQEPEQRVGFDQFVLVELVE